MQFSKFPAGLLDIPCADVFLDKLSGFYIENWELSVVTPESVQERELVRVFSVHTQCADALLVWRKNCKDEANYRYRIQLHVCTALQLSYSGTTIDSCC